MPDDSCVHFAHRFLLKLLETFSFLFFFKSVTTRVFPFVLECFHLHFFFPFSLSLTFLLVPLICLETRLNHNRDACRL